MKYRSDVDGLRALAVLPVLFYHGGMSLFSGGYVGVDIFFVISGYLITSVIIEEVKSGTFTISNFYLRRIKRIFPVLFFILLVTTLLCMFFQMPYDLRNYGKSLTATVFFGSNIYFNKQMGYFTDAAESKPLLHTWSLSVEEQFYIFYPIILMLICRYLGGHYRRYVLMIVLLSFGVSVVMINGSASDTFYLLHPRAWELGLGALLALGIMPSVGNRAYNESLSAIGLLMILYSVVFYTAETKFPAQAALLPCVGAFLLIYTGSQGTIVGRILSVRPVVFIGLISYSLYLWHWPLLSFFNTYRPVLVMSDTSADLVRYALLVLSFILSVLSYRYIETPFRKMKPQNLKVFFRKTFAVMVAISLLGAVIYWADGLAFRLPKAVAQIDRGHDEMEKLGSCKDRNTDKLSYETIRRIGAEGGEPSFIVFGDSHAGAFSPGFDKYGKDEGLTGLMVANNGLMPMLGNGHERKDCFIDVVKKTIDIINSHDNIKKVFLVSRWVIHVNGRKGADPDSRKTVTYDADHNPVPEEDVQEYIYENLKKTVLALRSHGKEVFITTGVPEKPLNVPNMMAKIEYLKSTFGLDNLVDLRPTVSEHETYQADTLSILQRVASETGAKLLRSEDAFRNRDKYELVNDGRSNYMDGNHVNIYGARLIVRTFADQAFGD